MAGGVPSSAARRSSAADRRPHGNAARPHFHPSTPSPSRTSPLDAHYPWRGTAVSAHSTSLRDPRAYGMRELSESLSISGVHTNAGNRTTSRLNLPLTIWSSGSARWKACRIPPIES
ncbi:mitochondrial processing peptide beta subunit [Trypanosoma cruzi]|nr:mitochondrial processing peptide beta subunit [Trypanosoma cruzi]